MRYAMQNRSYNCGPTVLLNALKWAGYPVSNKKHIKKLEKMVCCNAVTEGTWCIHVQMGLIELDELDIVGVLHLPRLKDIDRELDKGRAVVLRYFHEQCGHFVLITERTKKYYTVINDSRKKAVSRKSRKRMSKMLKKKVIDPGSLRFSVAWSIEPAEEPL